MIKGFRCRETERLFGDQLVPRFRAIERAARRKLLLLHRATPSGGYAFAGRQVTPMTSRSLTIIVDPIEDNAS